MRWRSCSPLPGRTSGFTVPNIRLAIMRTVTLSGTSNSGTILSVGTPDSSTGRRSKSTTSTWNSRSQRELTVNQLSGKLGADQVEFGCGEGDGIGVDRCVDVGVVVGGGAVAVVGGLQCEEPVPPVERDGCW